MCGEFLHTVASFCSLLIGNYGNQEFFPWNGGACLWSVSINECIWQ